MTADGLKIEAAAGVTLRDMLRHHMKLFGLTIRTDRQTGQAVAAAYIDGLSAVMALTIVARQGSREEIINAVTVKLLEAVDRDLRHLKP